MDDIENIIEFIINNSHLSNRELEKELNFSRHKISDIKKQLSIKQRIKRLDNDEINYILKHAYDKTNTEIAFDLNIPSSTVRSIWQRYNIDKKKLFEPNANEFIKNYNKLKSSRKMGELYNVSKATILNYARSIGYVNKEAQKRLLNNDDINEVISFYDYATASELSGRYGCSPERIIQVWMNAGLKGKTNRTYYSNFNYFETIDSKDKAYFLGFIAADGCVYDRRNGKQQKLLSIAIHEKDECILKTFLKCIESNNPIIHYTSVTDKDVIVPVSQLQIVSDKLCDDLSQYNIVPQKTWTYDPTNIPEEYTWHFLRGFFDGDGSITCSRNEFKKPSYYNVNFVGNEYVITYINSKLNKNGIKTVITKDKNKYKFDFFSLTISNTASRYRFLKLLYNDCGNLYLTRKKELADMFIESCDKNYTKRVKLSIGVK